MYIGTDLVASTLSGRFASCWLHVHMEAANSFVVGWLCCIN